MASPFFSVESNLPDYFGECHPHAKEVLQDDLFWSYGDEFSPIGNDTAADMLLAFWKWREHNHGKPVTKFLRKELERWGYSAQDLNAIANGNAHFATGKMHLITNVYDEAAIALTFAQFMKEGEIDEDLRTVAATAIARQSSAEVAQYRNGQNPHHTEAMKKIRDAFEKMPAHS